MRTFKSVVALLGSLAFLLTVGVVGASAAVAAGDVVDPGSAPPIRVSTYNLCGHACVVAEGTPPEIGLREATVAAEGTGAWNADVIFLQEVCEYQYDDIATRLPGYTGHYAKTVEKDAVIDGHTICRGWSSYGMAVFSKGARHADADRPVEDERDGIVNLDLNGYTSNGVRQEPENITSPCMRVYLQNRSTWVCSVHLYWGDESIPAKKALRDAEAVRLSDTVKRWQGENVPVVLGGDFNTQPWNDGTKPFYSPEAYSNTRGTGAMTEVDETDVGPGFFQSVCTGKPRCRSGERTKDDTVLRDPNGDDTADRKIDYIFFTSSFFTDERGDALPVNRDVSDHAILHGAARWQDCASATPAAGAVFRVDAGGGLYRYAGKSGGTLAGACKVGFGWGGMKRIARQGDTVVAVDGNGLLWRYPVDPATGSYSGSTRVQVGSGLQSLSDTKGALLAPGDTDHDGYPDLLVRDGLGDLWRYPGTADGGYAQQAAVKLDPPAPGQAWGDYDTLIAAGDFARDGAAAPDLVARDAAGGLWLLKGTATGGYQAPVPIDNGWQVYTALAAPGDLDGDGNPDLVARDHESGKTYGYLWFHKGDGTGGYAPGVRIGNGYPDGEVLF
ncbi:endonuclease/exonuclease/phosphatase family protein [Kitasatospora sp. NPDC005856]|uniref:endonuclease/exonuclease/phosphatase family protein n=1 Tax=Kitasatospora sp. NPDC005856 TaxID=3154566 RepID=UPI0033DD89E9